MFRLRKSTRGVLSALLIFLLSSPHSVYAIGGDSYVRFEHVPGGFPFAVSGKPAPLFVSANDEPGVLRVLKMFQSDIGSVTGSPPEVLVDPTTPPGTIVVVGTIGRNSFIDRLIRERKLDVSGVAGAWETFIIQPVANPVAGVTQALIVAGSDKRGTIYGMFDLSQSFGVSPWYWWGDVPVKHHRTISLIPGRHTDGPPSVKYRGIFLNDEKPDLTNWVRSKYGEIAQSTDPPIPPGIANYGHQFYERIFELLLRLKGNYLWPAMWDNAFNEDDPENTKLADEYGIVMGTSHQEPMLRAQKEWDRRYKSTLGSWNYARYPDTLQNFWREGIRRNKDYESIITIGLRGADDTPMAPGGPEANMALLEKIVGVQRGILADEMHRDVTRVPQTWCLYKEVLDFYNAGMRAPDDVTLLWPDDNWGNIRRLPSTEERKRSGGAGIYYHFDYHGGPRSYQWINANPIAKVWEQMSLAKEYGADRIWIVNVGHLKGYEFPIEYFMDLAWNAKRWTNQNINEYTRLWAAREFGPMRAREIADIISKYSKYNGRRKPELLSPTTYSLVNYHEAEKIVDDFKAITDSAESIFQKLPADEQDPFYELVLFPTKASSVVNQLYLAAGRNALYARQGRASTNDMAEDVRSFFTADTALMGFFNRTFARGKWDHFMDQSHLGYTNWQDPPTNSLRAIHLSELDVPEPASLGVAVEGSEEAWPGGTGEPTLPSFDPYNRQRRSVEIFNRGKIPFGYTAAPDRPWIKVTPRHGESEKQTSLQITVDWSRIPKAGASGTVTISGAGRSVNLHVNAIGLSNIDTSAFYGFMESEGSVSMEAEHFTKKTGSGSDRWIRIEDYGHTLSAMRAVSPADAPPATPGRSAPCLEYRMYLLDTGTVQVEGRFGASLNFRPGRGLRYAVSFDDEAPQIVTLVPPEYSAQNGNRDWERVVEDNGRCATSTHRIPHRGYHTLKFWMVDAGVVLEKIVVNCGGVRPSYLGPPESFHRLVKNDRQR